ARGVQEAGVRQIEHDLVDLLGDEARDLLLETGCRVRVELSPNREHGPTAFTFGRQDEIRADRLFIHERVPSVAADHPSYRSRARGTHPPFAPAVSREHATSVEGGSHGAWHRVVQ